MHILWKTCLTVGDATAAVAKIIVHDNDESADHDPLQLHQNDHENEGSEQDEEIEPGSKRHHRTHSLETAVEVPQPKRHSRYQSLVETSAETQDFMAAYLVDLVGDMPTN